VSTSLGSQDEGSEEATRKSYIRHSTFNQAPRHQQKFVPANQSGEPKKNKSRRYKRKPHKTNNNYGYEGLLSLMQGMLMRMANMDKTCKAPQWVK
jgi:hypothetical protein